jgi:hypothetical protein
MPKAANGAGRPADQPDIRGAFFSKEKKEHPPQGTSGDAQERKPVGGIESAKTGSKRKVPAEDPGLTGERPLKINPAVVEPAKVGSDNDKINFLNGLPLDEAKELVNLMRVHFNVRSQITKLSSEVAGKLDNLKTALSGPRDGPWYKAWATYEVVTSNAKSEDHPRWQIAVDAGFGSVASKIQSRVSQRTWFAMKALVPAGAASRQLKVQVHHVAYAALPVKEQLPIPTNAGSGGSISHACDQKGCIASRHLSSTPVHRDNMSRQRCPGVTLVVCAGQVVKEIPCPHAISNPAAEDLTDLVPDASPEARVAHGLIQRSCIGITWVELVDADVALVNRVNNIA